MNYFEVVRIIGFITILPFILIFFYLLIGLWVSMCLMILGWIAEKLSSLLKAEKTLTETDKDKLEERV